ncbi:uncharacterized protein C8Q71DRAFT_533626 [Rhodofomes roseus]|uniref:RING-type domain-containing protein n=1 Tax=Rhodofomes roseus TaxID=34475 RepID=A0ABQ8KK36_9APHY|nr:uncharacterized protein C8Q71DRAFT_533626 [Rhodofomes roseus]KAH9838509.1 hypothetical protein C8Q71DRAFT_533626 [Rhodofomes roseus]
MPTLDVLAALWRCMSRRLFYEILFVCLLSRIYATSVALGLGLFDARRVRSDPQYKFPISNMFAPELHGGRGLMWMLLAWQVPIILIFYSWEYRQQDGDEDLTLDNLEENWQRVLGLIYRYAITGSIMAVILHSAYIVGNINVGLIVLACIATVYLTNVLVWPLVTWIKTGRGIPRPPEPEPISAPIPVRTSRRMRGTCDDLLEALPILRRHDVPLEDQCAICCETFQDVCNDNGIIIKIPGCEHVFCQTCISGWLHHGRSTCPMCRHNFLCDAEYLLAVASLARGGVQVDDTVDTNIAFDLSWTRMFWAVLGFCRKLFTVFVSDRINPSFGLAMAVLHILFAAPFRLLKALIRALVDICESLDFVQRWYSATEDAYIKELLEITRLQASRLDEMERQLRLLQNSERTGDHLTSVTPASGTRLDSGAMRSGALLSGF